MTVRKWVSGLCVSILRGGRIKMHWSITLNNGEIVIVAAVILAVGYLLGKIE